MSDARAERRRRTRFLVLVEPVLDDLFRFARRLTGDAPRGEDLLQQALVVGLEKLDQLQEDGAFRAWMHRIVYRTFLNQRARRTEDVVEPAEVDNVLHLSRRPDDDLERRRLASRLGDALDALPPDQREVVWLVDGQGFSYAEAASILDVGPGTAASRVARGRMALRTALHDVAVEQGVIR